jgi:hypothetical protein
MLLPRAHVNQLWMSNGQKVDAIDVSIEGQERTLMPPLISPNCSVILASSTIEATRLAMESFRTPRMGSNLMAHLRSNITLRVPRSCLPDCHRSLSISKQLR